MRTNILSCGFNLRRSGEAIGAPIIEDEEIDLDQQAEQPREPPVAVREFEIG